MSESLKLWDCPTCGFAFDADHQDIDPVTCEGNGNHTCPLCELAEKDQLIASLQEQLRQANDCAAHWACLHHAEEARYQKQKAELAEVQKTQEFKHALKVVRFDIKQILKHPEDKDYVEKFAGLSLEKINKVLEVGDPDEAGQRARA